VRFHTNVKQRGLKSELINTNNVILADYINF